MFRKSSGCVHLHKMQNLQISLSIAGDREEVSYSGHSRVFSRYSSILLATRVTRYQEASANGSGAGKFENQLKLGLYTIRNTLIPRGLARTISLPVGGKIGFTTRHSARHSMTLQLSEPPTESRFLVYCS